MPKHYGDKKKKKRKPTPFDDAAVVGMTSAFKKLTAPKSIKPKAPKPPKVKPPKVKPELAPPRNRRTGEDYLSVEARRKKKKK